MWLAASSGLAWSLFGPALIGITRRHPIVCAHACLVTMCYGELVLQCGALVNLAARLLGMPDWFAAVPFNMACVGCSNIIMAGALAEQLKAIGVPRRRTLAGWFLILNGSGALFAYALRSLLSGA